ncbi:MAG: hypothetical protein BM485_00880 [Desulfobulbaceae bacterium DB1]|nr:MAG: hypothetical protein BM485_00880 [Desulfobulbaceae bacterium DB1]
MKLSLISFNCRYTHSCLSLFYLRNQLEAHVRHAHVSLHQFTINDPYYAALMRITSMNADAYFFSVYIWNADLVSRIIHDLAVLKPDAPIVLGGPQASAMDWSQAGAKISLVTGEIEGIDPKFYADLMSDSLADRYECSRSHFFPSPFRPADYDEHLANRSIYYESSRGCPYSCSYCISSTEPGIRLKELELVKRELAEILAHQPKSVRFVDRTFNASAARTMEIWNFLLAEPHRGTTFHFEISPDLFTEDMFALLREVPPGCFQFEIGIQSTNPETLAAINRKTNIPVSLNNIIRLAALDSIHLHVDLILGLPHEDMESFARSFNAVFAAAPHYIQMGLLKVLPNTPLALQVGNFSILHCRRPPHETLATKWLTHDELAELYWFGECVEAFHNNRYFRSFFRCIRKKEPHGFDFFRRLLIFCRKENFFHLARTQELMSRILLEFIQKDREQHILSELLLFDWLRSGHRFLPSHLNPNALNAEKNELWQQLPQELPPFYTGVTRNNFFKKALFVKFSGQCLRELNLNDTGRGILCFLPEKEETVDGLIRVVFLAP